MGWIFDRIVEMRSPPAHYNSRYRREFRKMVSTLNRELDTVEIKQCNGRTQDIIYENKLIHFCGDGEGEGNPKYDAMLNYFNKFI